MTPEQAYIYCPRCAGRLTKKAEHVLTCINCHFNLYMNPSPSNAVIIENEKGEILLVKRAINPHIGEWDLPGGFINAGEDFAASVHREVHEELGVEIKIERIAGAYEGGYEYQDIIIPTLAIVAVARLVTYTFSPADDVSDYKFFPKEEVLQQTIAFKGVRQALVDYLKSNSSSES